MNKKTILVALTYAQKKARSTWSKGVYDYAIDTVEKCDWLENITNAKAVFNHCDAVNMDIHKLAHDLSFGGCYEIYDDCIARLLCTPSEKKRFFDNKGHWRGGQPNKNECWLDVQTRAIIQAYYIIDEIISIEQE